MCYEFAVGAADCPRVARRATPQPIAPQRPAAASVGAPGDDSDDDDMPDLTFDTDGDESDDGLSDGLPDHGAEDADDADAWRRDVETAGSSSGVAAGPALPMDVRARVDSLSRFGSLAQGMRRQTKPYKWTSPPAQSSRDTSPYRSCRVGACHATLFCSSARASWRESGDVSIDAST
jgi:hypothetical protein